MLNVRPVPCTTIANPSPYSLLRVGAAEVSKVPTRRYWHSAKLQQVGPDPHVRNLGASTFNSLKGIIKSLIVISPLFGISNLDGQPALK